LGLVLQVEGSDTVKWFRHQAGWASGVCSQKEWVTEGAQEGKRGERALRKTKWTVGVLIAPKAARRQDAKTGALPDRTRAPKPETEFPSTTLLDVKWLQASDFRVVHCLAIHDAVDIALTEKLKRPARR
jgi:hypothetical protein